MAHEMTEPTLRAAKRLSVEMSVADAAEQGAKKTSKTGSRTGRPLSSLTNITRTAGSTRRVGDAPMAVENVPPSSRAGGSSSEGKRPALLELQSPKEHLSGYPKPRAPTAMDTRLSISGEGKEAKSPATGLSFSVSHQAAPKRVGGDSFVLDTPLVQYLEDVHVALRQNEMKYRAKPDYMKTVQKDITATMRGILVAWLVEVAEEYTLSSQTLFLTVNYIDRLLSEESVHRSKLQLIGITSMLIAAKYEEIYPPSVDDFVYIADHTYTRHEVLQMETVILNTLNFALTNATPWEFVRRYSKLGDFDAKTTALSHYMPELFMHETEFYCQTPSQVAAASCYIAHWATHGAAWRELERLTGYTLAQLRPVVKILLAMYKKSFKENSGLQAVKSKFSEKKWFHVSQIPVPSQNILG